MKNNIKKGTYETQIEHTICRKLKKIDRIDLERQTFKYETECGECKIIIPAKSDR